ncbi:MAG: ParB/RepB/Spo0J family partition protein [Acidobacteriia bacterium]|nr:ParB/RepB/Spo0J family partition protein [Terriglobia bacterium]
MAFRPQGLTLRLADIVATKQMTANIRTSPKYKQIAASVAEVGIIEPLMVYPLSGQTGKYVLLGMVTSG